MMAGTLIPGRRTPEGLRVGKAAGGGRRLALVLYVLYLTVILTTAATHLNSAIFIEGGEDEYRYHLDYPDDGRQGHYTVDRQNASGPATIDVLYEKDVHTLTLSVRNLKNITVHTKDLFMDEAERILEVDPTEDEEYYQQYFMERNLFTLNLESSEVLNQVIIEDIVRPDKVFIDGVLASGTDQSYHYLDDDVVIFDIPAGVTKVEIYYDYDEGLRPPDEREDGDDALFGGAVNLMLLLVAVLVIACVAVMFFMARRKKHAEAENLQDAPGAPHIAWDDEGDESPKSVKARRGRRKHPPARRDKSDSRKRPSARRDKGGGGGASIDWDDDDGSDGSVDWDDE